MYQNKKGVIYSFDQQMQKKKYYEARLGLKPMIILNDIGIKAKFKLLTWIFMMYMLKYMYFV